MFEIILFSLVAVTGVVILGCKLAGIGVPEADSSKGSKEVNEPWYLDLSKSFFPVLLLVFVLRGFVAEPFRIPSGSMLPTLEIGDFILVNKFSYGIRLPVLKTKVVSFSGPERGDVMVFRYPKDNQTHYIKRVVGLPGDKIEYIDKRLYINGELINNVDEGTYTPFGKNRELRRFEEKLPGKDHSILIDRGGSRNVDVSAVPEGHYFVLGDNRDHSLDSRYWGFVPDENVVGKAFFVWFHWNGHPDGGVKTDRIGTRF
jgi:signal peptidase I